MTNATENFAVQVDREEHWDDYIILQLYVATGVHLLPWLYCWDGKCYGYRGFPTYHNKGLVQLLLIHAGKRGGRPS